MADRSTEFAELFVSRTEPFTTAMLDEIPRAALAASLTLRDTSVAPRTASLTLRDISLAALATSEIERAMSLTPRSASETFRAIVLADRVCFSTEFEIRSEEALIALITSETLTMTETASRVPVCTPSILRAISSAALAL